MTNGLPVGLPLLCRRPIKKMIFFHYPRVSPGAAPLTKKPEDSGYEIASYPESSGFLVSGVTPGRLWGHRKNSIFLIGCSVTVSIVLPQKSCGNKIRCPQSLPGVAPLTKKPEDSGYEIDLQGPVVRKPIKLILD